MSRVSRTDLIVADRRGDVGRPLRSPDEFVSPIKRLIVCCDGTWLNSDNGMLNGKLQVESNVTRISRAILPEDDRGIQQIVYYGKGVATEGGMLDRVVMGAVGEGLNQNVREAYSFLSNNYAPGDEIYLVGFSRGAFTARTVAGLIGVVGLLTKRGTSYLPEVFKDVLNRRDQYYVPKHPDIPFPNKPSASSPRYKEELVRRGLTDLDVSVKAIGVWDTVGSLGLPRIGVLTQLGLQRPESREMAFYDTKLSHCIENAFQALALDEHRESFSPAVWEKPEGNRTRLRQVWFPGVHSNIGGGYDDQELSNITLAWMMSQLSPFLEFDPDYILRAAADSAAYYRHEERRKRPRPWSFGLIENSMTGLYAIGGGTTRTPGQYYAADPDTGKPGRRPLRDTHEYIHPSVRARFALRGPGVEDKGRYEPPAMDDWKLVVEYPDRDGRGKPEVYWKARFSERNVTTRVLPESPLWAMERSLLRLDPETEEEVMRPPPTRRGG